MIAIRPVMFPVRKLSREAAVIWSRVARLQCNVKPAGLLRELPDKFALRERLRVDSAQVFL
jgi:hypothetical protein